MENNQAPSENVQDKNHVTKDEATLFNEDIVENATTNATRQNAEKTSEEREAELKKIDEQIKSEREKELQLQVAKNKLLEDQLKGKSFYIQEETKEEKTTKEVNEYLKGTGLSI